MCTSTVAGGHVLTALVLAAGLVRAAELDRLKGTTPAQRAEMQTTMMQAKLGLSEVQVAQVRALNEKYAQQMEPVINGSEGPLIRLRHARAIQEQKDAELKGVLTPEQFTKYEAGKEEVRNQLLQRFMKQHPNP